MTLRSVKTRAYWALQTLPFLLDYSTFGGGGGAVIGGVTRGGAASVGVTCGGLASWGVTRGG